MNRGGGGIRSHACPMKLPRGYMSRPSCACPSLSLSTLYSISLGCFDLFLVVFWGRIFFLFFLSFHVKIMDGIGWNGEFDIHVLDINLPRYGTDVYVFSLYRGCFRFTRRFWPVALTL